MTDLPADPSARILARLHHLHPKLIDLSLGRMERLLNILGNPETQLPPVLHIAGTNGKGSTVVYLEAMLRAAGQRVDAYTSPHLVHFNERIRLDGTDIAAPRLASLLRECETANAGAPITFFEITTAAALLAFARSGADFLVLEVGLGGRLDATNVVPRPALSIITPVSIDHTQYLGDTLAEIAGEKAGILKPCVPAIIGEQAAAADAVIEARAAELNVPLSRYGREWKVRAEREGLRYEGPSGSYQFPLPALIGRHQIGNAGIAIAALEAMGAPLFSPTAVEKGLRGARWPGRLQQVSPPLLPAGWELWLDGGHNEAAGVAIAEAISWRDKPLYLIVGMLNTKPPADFLRPLAAHSVGLTGVAVPNVEASFTPQDICQAATGLGLANRPAENVQSALDRLIREEAPGRVLICGSLYLIGTVLADFELESGAAARMANC
ncbi:MAG: bifunctional folylpolyglutamate synthase/dihydrofolate synthase [Proteobacteria bacterium]|nr:bifunctional folylpolyglutamate synthase/dihydrofolate synthase [Pseudomonadota bacterium]MDA1356751.1 bifunctional folylpolyglutamate synthase/dihydrofolate synthase [Pseudomonadota bacterium]